MSVVRWCVAAALAVGSTLAWVAPAVADDCPVMTFEFDPGQGALVLSPTTVTVPAGGCVTFNNQTATPARFAVGSGYRNDVPPFSETTGDGNYQATDAGTTQPVTATGPGGQASGSIVIEAAAPPPSSSAPAPPPTSAPPPTAPASSPPASHPAKPTPKKSSAAPVVTPTASPPPVSPVQTKPAGPPPVVAGQTTPSPSPSRSTVVVAGPLQPPTGRGTGLPAAVAAVVIVGTAAALLRVLLSYPISAVDGRHSVGAAS